MELQILPKKNDEVFFSLFKQPLTAAPCVLNIHVSSFFLNEFFLAYVKT